MDQWRREREAAIATGQPDPYEGFDDREWRWLEARKPKIVEGKPKFDCPETEAESENFLQLAELQKQGKFKPHRERDVLSTTIGSKEHGGHVRGLSSKLSLKDGFEKDRSRYRSHKCYKEEIVAAAETAMEAKFKDLLRATLAEQQSGQLLLNSSQEVGQQQMVAMPAPPPVLGQSSSCAQSSVASTTGEPYPVDRIMGTTLCLLLYPIGRNGKTKEVAKAQMETIVG